MVRRVLGGALSSALLVIQLMLLPTAAHAGVSEPRVTVSGNVTPGLVHAQRLGDVSGGQPMSVAVTLGPRNAAELRAFIDAVSNPHSSAYGQYLTEPQFTERFGPDPATVRRVGDYLRSQGLAITSVSSNRSIIHAAGQAASVERAFGTRIGRWHDPALNRDFLGNDSEPNLPASIGSSVVDVAGLNDHYRQHHHALPRAPQSCPGGAAPAGALCPAQAKTAYDLDPLTAAGFNGSGQTVGLFELDGFQQSNLDTYSSTYSLGPLSPTVHVIDGGSGPLGPGQVEVELDIEVVRAYAPGAAVSVWEGPNTGDQGVIDTYNDMVVQDVTRVNSTSWGLCEPDTTPALMRALDNVFMQAAAQGMSFFAASGDTGKYDCAGNPNSTSVAVDNPADDPFMTGVGGTRLTTNSDFTYGSETAWSNPSTIISPPQGRGGGGGVSTVFQQPTWQTGTISQSGTRMRQVPDVSMEADPNTGYAIYTAGSWRQVGGTSAAAPAWAAYAAVFNQRAASSGKPPLGFATPTIYSIASVTPAALHDVTAGNNAISTKAPYDQSDPAVAGWDYATGWGSLDASNLTNDILAITPAPPTVTRVNPPAGLTSGGTAVTVSGTGLGFSYGTTVRRVSFGGTSVNAPCTVRPVPCFTVTSGTSLTVYSPAHAAGPAPITVTTDAGTSAATPADGYQYVTSPPPPGPQALTVVRYPSGLFTVFGRGADGHVDSASQMANGAWTPFVNLGGAPSTGVAAAINPGGTASGFYIGADFQLHSATQQPNGVWTPWVNLGGALTGEPVAFAYPSGLFTAFARDLVTGSVDSASQNPDGTWTPWANLGGAPASEIAALVNNGGTVSAFYTGDEGHLHSATQQTNGVWTPWVDLGGALSGRPVAFTYPSGLFTAFARGQGGGVRSASQNPDGTWSPWANLGGAPSSDVAALRSDSGTVSAFYIAANRHMQTASQMPNGVWTPWVDLGGNLAQEPTAVSFKSGLFSTFGINAVGHGANSASQLPDGTWTPWADLGGSF